MKTETHAKPHKREKERGYSCLPNGGLENPPSVWDAARIADITIRTQQRNPGRDPEKRSTYVNVSSVSNTSFKITEPTELPGAQAPTRAKKEQDEIIANVDCLDRKLAVHQRKHAALTALFRTLLHQLMTAQIRVDDLELCTEHIY